MRFFLAFLCVAACSSPEQNTEKLQPNEPDSFFELDAEIENDAEVEDNVDAAVSTSCKRYEYPVSAGKIEDPDLIEISGLCASRKHPGLLWAHNDSGDDSLLYLMDETGGAHGRTLIRNVKLNDAEDIACAPCPPSLAPGEFCVWLGDIGNSISKKREILPIYVIPEPDLVEGKLPEEVDALAKIEVSYPDSEIIDSEALVVSNDGTRLFLFEKIDAASARVFGSSGSISTSDVNSLDLLGSFASPGVPIHLGRMITGADLYQSSLVIRVYTGIYQYQVDPENFLPFSEMLQVALGPLTESQGEAVAYSLNGEAIFSASEGSDQDLHRTQCGAQK